MNAVTKIKPEVEISEGGPFDPANMPAPIAAAVIAIMKTVKNVEKHGENKFHNYKFAKVEDLIFQVQPAMADAGLIITQDEIGHEIVADALMLATYGFGLSHEIGVTWAAPTRQTGMASLKNTKGGYDDKALNKCHTAARKYFILGLFQIPAGDLPDVDVEEERPQAPAPSLEDRAITHLRTCAAVGKPQFKDAWEANKDGWKKTMDGPAYARVVAEMKRLAGAFPKDEPEPPPPQQAAEDFGLADDDLPEQFR